MFDGVVPWSGNPDTWDQSGESQFATWGRETAAWVRELQERGSGEEGNLQRTQENPGAVD